MASIYRVRTVLAGWQGAAGLSTCYFDAPTTANSTDAQTGAVRVRGAWDVVKTILPTAMTATVQTQVDVLADGTGQLLNSFTVSPGAVVTGTAATGFGPTPVMAGLVLTTGTIVNGRRLVGRLFVGPLGSGSTNSPAPPAGVVTAVNAFGVALVTVTPTSSVPQLVVWHRPNPVSGVGGSSAKVLGSTTAGKWFTLRSRRD